MATAKLLTVKLQNSAEKDSILTSVDSELFLSVALDTDLFPNRAIIWFQLDCEIDNSLEAKNKKIKKSNGVNGTTENETQPIARSPENANINGSSSSSSNNNNKSTLNSEYNTSSDRQPVTADPKFQVIFGAGPTVDPRIAVKMKLKETISQGIFVLLLFFFIFGFNQSI